MVTPEFDDAVAKRIHATQEIKRLKGIIEEANKLIDIMIDLDGRDQIPWDVNDERYLIYRRRGSRARSSVSVQKLLEQGVPAHVIRNATIHGKEGKPSIVIKKVGEQSEEEEAQ